jgi:NCS1 family nucleobase:cation symporter-1
VICVYISPPVSSLSPVAVYPPKTIEEEEERLRSLGHSDSSPDIPTPSDEKLPVDV